MRFKKVREIVGDYISLVKKPIFWVTALSLIPAIFLKEVATSNMPPRRNNLGCLTLMQYGELKLYNLMGNRRQLYENPTVDQHLEQVGEDFEDIKRHRKNIWLYNNGFLGPLSEGGENSGKGLHTIDDFCQMIVDGKVDKGPFSCFEGTSSSFAHWYPRVKDPNTGDEFDHYVLLMTYEKSDIDVFTGAVSTGAGHALHVIKKTSTNGVETYAIGGGFNPFEGSNEWFPNVEGVVEVNMNHFRLYVDYNLHNTRRPDGELAKAQGHRIMIRPDSYCLIHPVTDLGVDIINGDKSLGDDTSDWDVRNTKAQNLQLKFQKYFDKYKIKYVEKFK
tara:strand:+ start:11880 stop:12875 length:996 start_codon:yes stop_codon:yes gene_type:complete